MPFKALSAKDNRVVLAYWFRKSRVMKAHYPNGFICPVCKEKVSARGGNYPGDKRNHFYHPRGTKKCPTDRIKEGLSSQNLTHHQMGVRKLYDYLIQEYHHEIKNEGWFVDVEYYNPLIPERIADLAVLDEEGAVYQVHEFQLTKIPVTKLEERTESYEKANIDVVWWFGKGCDCEEVRLWSLRRFGQHLVPVIDFSSYGEEVVDIDPSLEDNFADRDMI